MKNKETIAKILIIIVFFLYVAARFWNLTDSCLWFDEIFSVHAAEHSWSDLWEFVRLDLIHPPLFYVLLKVWIAAGGEPLLWLRLFPVLFSVLALIPFWLLCRELNFSEVEKLTALAFFSLNGLLVKYSQEVRMYSLLMCASLFSIWLFVKVLNEKRNSNFFWLFAINLLLIYIHYFGWLIVATEVLIVLILRRELLKRFGFGLAFLAIGFAPWFLAVARAAQTNSGLKQNIGWATKPGIKTVSSFVLSLVEPFYYQQNSGQWSNLWFTAVPFAFVCFGAIVFAIFNEKNNFAFRLLTIFVTAPILIAFAASWILPYSVWGNRHLIIVFAPASLLVALALNRLHPIALRIAAYAILSLLILASGIFHFARPKTVNIWCGWETLVKSATERENGKMTIYAFEDLVAYHLWFATKDSDRVQIVDVKNLPGVEEDKAYFLPRGFSEVKVADRSALDGEHFWIAFRDKTWNPNHPLLQDLMARGYKLGAPLELEATGETAFLIEVKK